MLAEYSTLEFHQSELPRDVNTDEGYFSEMEEGGKQSLDVTATNSQPSSYGDSDDEVQSHEGPEWQCSAKELQEKIESMARKSYESGFMAGTTAERESIQGSSGSSWQSRWTKAKQIAFWVWVGKFAGKYIETVGEATTRAAFLASAKAISEAFGVPLATDHDTGKIWEDIGKTYARQILRSNGQRHPDLASQREAKHRGSQDSGDTTPPSLLSSFLNSIPGLPRRPKSYSA